MKGYKTPKSISKKIMPTKAPMKSNSTSFKAPDLTTRIPDVRPTGMRNHGPLKGKK